MPTVLLAGGTGLIGTRLAEMLRAKAYSVRILTRTPKQAGQFAWNPSAGTLDEAALQDVDFVVNLAGAGIAERRWTNARKREIVESRLRSAHTLRDAFQRTGWRPKAYLSASAIGYYGNSGERLMTEADSPIEQSFMVECCKQWEQAADEIAQLGVRTVKFRIGIVLAKEGGALAEFVKPLRLGIGGYFGNGQAWYSWIHRDDVCRFFIWAMEHAAVQGVFNAVAPQPARNKDLIKSIASALRQPALFIPAPTFGLRIFFGEMSAAILNSNRVSAEKALKAGFEYEFPALDEALKQIL